jgi:bleomycin hydrolase
MVEKVEHGRPAVPSSAGDSMMTTIRKISLLFFFAVALTMTPAQASAPRCEDIFLRANYIPVSSQIGFIKPEFLAKFTSHYTKELPTDHIENQCALGVCGFYQRGNALERQYKLRTGHDIQLSREYLAFSLLKQRSLALLEADPAEKEIKLNLSVTIVGARSLIRKFGLIPKAFFHLKQDFNSEIVVRRMTAMIKNYVANVRKELLQVPAGEERARILRKRQADLETFFKEQFVEDTGFMLNGKLYFPDAFAKEFFPELFADEKLIFISADPKLVSLKPVKAEAPPDTQFFEGSVRQIETLIAAQIDKGLAVPLTYFHHPEYVDSETGIMSIEAFNNPLGSFGKPLSRDDKVAFGLNSNAHAVEIVGYERDPKTGRILKYKIRNSWGDEAGDGGYYHMMADYFALYASSVLMP